MRKVIVLGAQGMLGQTLVQVFRSHGVEVVEWDREDLDITDAVKAREKIFAEKPDCIINAVAYNAVDVCEQNDAEFQQAWRINAIAPGMLAEIARDLGAVFVHYSTDYVFDGLQQGEGYAEDAIPSPVSRYGESKAEGEHAVQKAGGSYYIIRLSKLFGLPAISEGAKKSFFEKMQEVSVGKESVSAVTDEIGCFTYAPDLANASYQLIADDVPFGIYHLVNEGSASWYDALIEYFKIVHSVVRIDPVSGAVFARPAKRPTNSTLRNTKRPKLRSYKEALRDFYELTM